MTPKYFVFFLAQPAYQNMVARVDMIVKKFLDEQKYINWRPFSKNQVRSQLRQHLMRYFAN